MSSINNTVSNEIELVVPENNTINDKYNSHNLFIAAIITSIYILLISKFAEVMSFDDDPTTDEKKSIGTYVMIIYFMSIIGIIFSYLFFKDDNLPDFIVKWSVNLGGILVIIYTVTNYWDYLDNYAKCTLLISTFVSIIYYLYKIY